MNRPTLHIKWTPKDEPTLYLRSARIKPSQSTQYVCIPSNHQSHGLNAQLTALFYEERPFNNDANNNANNNDN